MATKIDEALSTKVLDLLDKLKPILIELKNLLPEDMPEYSSDFESQFENKEHAAMIKELFKGME